MDRVHLLHRIPPDGKIACRAGRVARRSRRTRREFSRVRKLTELPVTMRGWTVDVLAAIRKLGETEFSLQELYSAESALKALHPRNQNVRPKIRQQLQVLRDVGLIRFTRRGNYEVEGRPHL